MFVSQLPHGHKVIIEFQENFSLPAVYVYFLGEISVFVEQSHPDNGQAQIGSTFQKISGKNPHPSGIYGNGFMDTKFHEEISGYILFSETALAAVFIPEAAHLLHIPLKLFPDLSQLEEKTLIFGKAVQFLFG